MQNELLVRYFGALPVGQTIYLGVEFEVRCCGCCRYEIEDDLQASQRLAARACGADAFELISPDR